MARRWFVNDADGIISGFTDDDDVAAPTGFTATTIADDAAGVPAGGPTAGSTWDPATSTYTERSGVGITTEFDLTTELGRKQTACDTLHQYLKGVTEGIHEVRHEKPQADVEKAEQFIAMAHWATYVAAHMGMLIDNFETWVELMVMGAEHVSTIQELFQSVHGIGEDKIPVQACAWVSPIDQTEIADPGMARTKSTLDTPVTDTVATGGWFIGEAVDLTDVYLGDGDWIRSLTA